MKRLIWLLRLLLPLWPKVIFAVLLSILTISGNIGLMSASAYLLARAALHPPVLDLMVTIVGVRFFGLLRAVSRYLERYVSHDLTFRILSRLRTEFYERIEPLAPARLMNLRSADLLNRIVSDIELLQNFYLRAFAPPLAACLVLLGYGIFLARFDQRFSYILAACFLTAGLIVPWLIYRAGRGIGTKIVLLKTDVNTQISDGLRGMTELAAYGQTQAYLNKIFQTDKKLSAEQRKLTRLSALSSALLGMAANLGMWFVLVLGILLVEKGRLNGVNLGMLALGTLSSFEAIFPIAAVPQHLEQNLAAAGRLLELMESEPAVSDPSRTQQALPQELSDEPSQKLPLAGDMDLQFREVSFRYEKNERDILKNLSLHIPPKSKVAILGPSGAGKTSIVNLLLRFWDYEQGDILIGGHSVREYSADQVREFFGVVTQRTYLFNASLKENLLLAKPDASEEELIRACQQAKLHEFILSLPAGYDSEIGEAGLMLSGGQRQRLALARVLLKNAPILILDEATAGLDPQTELEVMREIQDLMAERTTLVITHNLIGLEIMDQILVLDQGEIIERGTHAELLAAKGYYFRQRSAGV